MAADPLDLERVDVDEEWETDSKLDAFRGDDPARELSVDMAHADGPAW